MKMKIKPHKVFTLYQEEMEEGMRPKCKQKKYTVCKSFQSNQIQSHKLIYKWYCLIKHNAKEAQLGTHIRDTRS